MYCPQCLGKTCSCFHVTMINKIIINYYNHHVFIALPDHDLFLFHSQLTNNSQGGVSHIKWTGALVGNFEKNRVTEIPFCGHDWNFFIPKKYQFRDKIKSCQLLLHCNIKIEEKVFAIP